MVKVRVSGLLGLLFFPAVSSAQDLVPVANSYGQTGLIDMPAAGAMPDGDLIFSLSKFQEEERAALTFQITPRLSGSFRYSFVGAGRTYDRAFSVRYELLEEGRYLPALAIGVNDIVGTSLYAGEYLVASKHLSPRLKVSGGLGWGRFAGVGSFENPLGALADRFLTRPAPDVGLGGTFQPQVWFHGDAALFGGFEWQATDRLRLVAEYSSDAYPRQDGISFDRKSPFNFGMTYQATPTLQLSGRYLYGSELGLQLTYQWNPARRPNLGSGLDPQPPAVLRRGEGAPLPLAQGQTVEDTVRAALKTEGIGLRGLSVGAGTATVEVQNDTYRMDAQAIGRTARIMSRTMPAEVDRFTIVASRNGMPVTRVTLARGDVERLELAPDGEAQIRAAAEVADAWQRDGYDLRPMGKIALEPYVQPSYFDPDDPLRADLGARLQASYEPLPGLVLRGSVQRKIIGNLDESTRVSTSVLPRVRSDANIYDREGEFPITELTANYYFRAGPDLFGRVSAGYLERMFGGVQGELLWKPQGKRYALGATVAHVRQRDFDQMFGFQDYSVTTGHLSAYYDFGNGYHGQLDIGRYLAGDKGATLTLAREFENGWRVSAFATLTDVPFEDFGEGSFDKGIRLDIPLEWARGTPSRRTAPVTLRPIQRDGGAKLDVSGQLYDEIRSARDPDLTDGWGRFWR